MGKKKQEMTLFEDEGQSKKYLELASGLEDESNLLGGGGFTGKKLSIRGSTFRKIEGGEEVGRIDDRTLNVVIVKAAPISRMYFDKAYVEGEDSFPKCWSADCKTPAESVPEEDRQAEKCLDCPMNVKGSGQGESRACTFRQKIAVMLEGEIEDDKVYQLSLPSKSVFGKPENDGSKMPMQAYAKFLASHNAKVAALITEMRFDTDSSTPKLTFRAVRPVSEEELEVIMKMQKADVTEEAISMNIHRPEGYDAPEAEDEEDDEPEKLEAPKKDKKQGKKKDKKKGKKKDKKPKQEEPDEEEDEPPKVKKQDKKPEPDKEEEDLSAILDDFDDDDD